jgi:hypothetical protein
VSRTRVCSLQPSRRWGTKRAHANEAKSRGSVLHVADVVETGAVTDHQVPAHTIKHVKLARDKALMLGSNQSEKTRMEKSKVYSERPTFSEEWRTAAADMHHRAAPEVAVENRV